ncbi:MAG: A/G-specific adenine glycosylase [Thermoguttaceae bacterium]|jgi:A/G-specific adenine glycosylase
MKRKKDLTKRQIAIEAARERAEEFSYIGARRMLLTWFDAHGRRFPWRDDPTPYRVLVSEIMLQQTTTQTVLGYFHRFLERFPSPAALADSSEEEVLAMWEGLGYYRRARALRKAAILMTERFNSQVPESYDELLTLPGVGKYCAGAIMSFGYDRRSPILEANTIRLHSRLIALELDPKLADSQRLLWQTAEDWLPKESSRRRKDVYRSINAALTDLGSMVCQPTEPRCDICPLSKYCNAFKLELQDSLPALKKKPAPVPKTDVAFWISRGDLTRSSVPTAPDCKASASDVLLMRRPAHALWAGLWDFPKLEVVDPIFRNDQKWRRDPELADRLALFLESEVGAEPKQYWPGAALKVFRHSVTRYRVTLALCRLECANAALDPHAPRLLFDAAPPVATVGSDPSRLAPSLAAQRLRGKPLASEWRWVPIAALSDYPLSSPGRKIASFIQKRYAR